jgi:methyl-accepting chemotaxis protein
MQEQLNYTHQFRKGTMYTIAVLGFFGNLAQLAWQFFGENLSPDQQITRLIIDLLVILLMLILFWLTYKNQVMAAAWVFCTVSTITLSVTLFNLGLVSYFPVLYVLVIVIAATFISPRSSIFFGSVVTGLFVGISFWKVSRLPSPVSVDIWANLAILTLVLIISTIILSGFSRSLGRLIHSVTQQANELARLNQNLQHLRQVEATTAQQVNHLTGTLSAIFKEQDLTSQEQARMVRQVAVTTREMDTAARKIADNAITVAAVADKAQRNAEVSQQAAYQGATAISAVRQRVQDISENMRVLTLQIERISEVTGIIGEIADETNLLALNATIEAAGAREYGRRFAAVADEVQRLARRSTNAVEQIQSMVQEINLASNKALSATEQGLRETQVSDQLVGSLTLANTDVTQLVGKTSTLVSSIAEATQQQREASAQTVEVVQRILIATNRLAEVSPEVSSIVNRLGKASEQLALTTENPSGPLESLSLAAKLPLTPPSRNNPAWVGDAASIVKNETNESYSGSITRP